MKSFEYAAPKKLNEALSLLGEKWGETELLAGGTDLVTCLKQKLVAPKRLVSLRNLKELQGVDVDSKRIILGASTTLEQVVGHRTIKEKFPSLVTAIQGIGSAQIISQGTIGGDLCQRPRCWYFRNGFGLFGRQGETSLVREGQNRFHAIFGNDGPALYVSPSSLAPSLVALGASMQIIGKNGKKRTVPAREFFQTPKSDSDRETVLQPSEILTAIEIPLLGLANGTYEVRHRHGIDWPYVTASVTLPSGSHRGAVVLGHVAPVPWVATSAGELLAGRPDLSQASKCGEEAAKGAKPLSQNAYKVQMVKVAVKRAYLEAAKIRG